MFAVFAAEVLLLALSSMAHHHHGDRICFGTPDRCPICAAESRNHRQASPQGLPIKWSDLGDPKCVTDHSFTTHSCNDHDSSEADCDLRALLYTYGRAHMAPVAGEHSDDGSLCSAFPLALISAVADRVPLPRCMGATTLPRYDAWRCLTQQLGSTVALRAPPYFIA